MKKLPSSATPKVEGGAATSRIGFPVDGGFAIFRGKPKGLRFASGGPGQPGKRDIVKIDRAQSRSPGARHIGCGLKNIELCSQSRAEISFRDLEGFIGVLHVAGFGYENPVCLLKVEERTPDIR